MIKEQDILNGLTAVIDPDLHKNIVELGFVQNLKVKENHVSFDLILTTPACPIRDKFKEECISIVKKLGASSVEVSLSSTKGRVEDNLEQNSSVLLQEVSNIVGVASGKGGVGKSTVTANLAMALSLSGAKVGILDADIYGPSMGLMFGIDRDPQIYEDNTIAPVTVNGGISIVSMCMFQDSDKATIWRGPMASQMVGHFLNHVRWGALDYLLIDFPPGTGDIQLTLTQNCPMTGAIVVTTPQEVALADCRKGLAMFDAVHVPVIGVVENMSYFVCDSCGKIHKIFREGGGEKISKVLGVPLVAKIPLEPAVADCGDLGIPAVLRYPNSESSKAFIEGANQMIQNLEILKNEDKGILKTYNYDFLELPLED